MKIISALSAAMLLAGSLLGQSVKAPLTSSEAARAEFMNPKYWSKIGELKDETKGFKLFSRNLFPNPEGQIEFWVKISPLNLEHFNRNYDLPANAAFVIQYATVDCSRRFILLERTGVYDSANTRLNSGTSELNPRSSRDRVKPGSISGEIYQSVCVRLE